MKIYGDIYRYVIPAALMLAVCSGAASAETLEEAVHAALATHPSVEGARATSGAAAQEKREAWSGYFPDIAISSTAGRIYGDNATSRGFVTTRGSGYSGLWEGSISAKETIFDGFETSHRVDSAKNKTKSADMNVRDVQGTIAYRTAQVYIDLLRARKGLAMLQEHQKKVDDYLGRIKNAVDSGSSDEAEHQQARDIHVILDGLVDDYQGQVRAAESNYFDLTGHAPEGELITPASPLDYMPKDIEEMLTVARDRHPSLHAAQYTSRSAAHEMEAEKSRLYPDVEGELSYLASDKRDLIGGEVEDGRAVVHLNWNFETGGAQLARISRKKYEHQEALARMQEAQRRVELGARLAWSEYQTAVEQLDNQQQRRELNEKLFSTYKVQFEGAKISLLQLMQADNQLFTTGLEKMNGQFRLLAAQYAVLSATGRIQESMGATVTAAAEPAVAVPVAAPKAVPVRNPLTHAEP